MSVGTDLTTTFTYLPPNLFAHYEQTNVLRITEYREVGKELLRETVGPNLVRHPGLPNVAPAHGSEPRLIAWGEDTSEVSGTVHVAGLDQPPRRWQWTSELMMPTPLAFSPDGKLLVLAGWQEPRRMEIREVTTGRLVLRSDILMMVPEYRPLAGFPAAEAKEAPSSNLGGQGTTEDRRP